jgi:hypothetical protein
MLTIVPKIPSAAKKETARFIMLNFLLLTS